MRGGSRFLCSVPDISDPKRAATKNCLGLEPNPRSPDWEISEPSSFEDTAMPTNKGLEKPAGQTSAPSGETRLSDSLGKSAASQLSARETVEETLADTRKALAGGTAWVRDMAEEKPFVTLLTAMGVGFVLGVILWR